MLLDKFSAGRQCLDDFMKDASKGLQVCGLRSLSWSFLCSRLIITIILSQDMDTLHKKFILDVVSGCIEHKKLLNAVISVFYGQNGKYLTRDDCSQFVSKSMN